MAALLVQYGVVPLDEVPRYMFYRDDFQPVGEEDPTGNDFKIMTQTIIPPATGGNKSPVPVPGTPVVVTTPSSGWLTFAPSSQSSFIVPAFSFVNTYLELEVPGSGSAESWGVLG